MVESEAGKRVMFSSVHVRSTLIGKVFPAGKTEGFNDGLGLLGL